ncbi:MAG: purine/pyrimidine permease [Gammaproteobacteria bacterium]|nr:purine/pyrimidine permease [Gammaproteobacteria bacterium]MCY4323712.1 purine/pyrimidine permease [Gammaproteobacteria bacterium]
MDAQQAVRFEPEDKPPKALSLGLGLQMAGLSVAGIVITPVVVTKAAGIEGAYVTWAVFAALLVSGASTVIQAVKVGPVGAGHVLLMGTSGAFISVCVAALAGGGPGLMAMLVLASSLVQCLLAAKLALLRRIVTPVVAGTVIMLIPVTVLPIIYGMLTHAQDTTETNAAAICVLVTLLVSTGLAMRARGAMRLWTPMAGVLAGTLAAVFLGIFDPTPILEAAWIGMPEVAWPDVALVMGAEFWALLPAFIMVTIVGMIETIGDSIAIQRVSRRTPLSPDYRVVQGAIYADGLGNFLSGAFATVPNTTYSSSVSITELTGVASRDVGLFLGATLCVLAFFPKFAALFVALPEPVAGAFLMLIIGLLFTVGIKVLTRDGLDHRKAVIVSLSLGVGIGFQYGLVFPNLFQGWLGQLLENGMTSGGLTAILLSALWELLSPRRITYQSALQPAVIAELEGLLRAFARKRGWCRRATDRLCLASEEVILNLLDDAQGEQAPTRYLRFALRDVDDAAELEYIASLGEENLENQILLLSDTPDDRHAHEVSLRILKSLASRVQHQKYYGIDIISLKVLRTSGAGGGT